jgi:hypothetical protein
MPETTSPISNRRKLALLGAIAVPMLVFGALYLVWAQTRVDDELAAREKVAQAAVDEFELSQSAATVVPPQAAVVPVQTGAAPQPGEVLVINRVPGDDYGRLAIRHTDGSRTLLERSCLRVHVAADRGVCLSKDDAIISSYTTIFFDTANPDAEIKSYAGALPSRVRVSPSGTFSSVTAFLTGSSYEDISTDTTTAVTIDDIDGNILRRDANQFEVLADDEKYDTFGSQYWGMTFVDEDEFYVTGFYGDDPEIMHGSLQDMTVTPTGWEGSCPSVSPDGKTIVFKELRPQGGFDLVAVDLKSGERWMLGEERSADDQVEWLDDDTILYALHPDGGNTQTQPEFDIWVLDIAPGSEPALFLPNADSPATMRRAD